jgi:hypothetical protein
MSSEDRAVVLGIDIYPALTDLSGAEADALRFAAWLKSGPGGDVPAASVVTILSSQFPRGTNPPQPTADAFRNAIDQIHTDGENNGGIAGRRLYLYLAGHGVSTTLDDAAVLMANAARNRTGHSVRGRNYAEWFRASRYFEQVVLVVDACRELLPLAPGTPCHLDPLYVLPPAEYFYALSTQFGAAARERVNTQNGGEGIFTSALLSALSMGRVTSTAVKESVLGAFASQPGVSPPDITFSQDLTFCEGQVPSSVRLEIVVDPPHTARTVAVIDGAFQPVMVSSVAGSTWIWELPAHALFHVTVSDGTRLGIDTSIGEAVQVRHV